MKRIPRTIPILAALLVLTFFLDTPIAEAVARLEQPWLTASMVAFTKFFWLIYVAMTAMTIALALRQHRGRSLLRSLLTITATVALFTLIKFIVHRERPAGNHLLKPFGKEDYSFPSGHAASTAAAALATWRWNGAGMLKTAWLCFTLISAFSRVYLSVHFPSDIIGGLLLAAVVEELIHRTLKAGLAAEDFLEIRRQVVHFLFGIGIAAFAAQQPAIAGPSLAALAALGYALSRLLTQKTPLKKTATPLLALFERKKELATFPGKGAILLFLGSAVTCVLFRSEAPAAILMLAVGDSISPIAGRLLGTHKLAFPFAAHKTLEGSAWGFIFSASAASLFLPGRQALLIATAAVVTEALALRIRTMRVDDNVSVPLASALALLLFKKLTLQ